MHHGVYILELSKETLEEALEQYNWNQSATAAGLGIHRSTVRKYMREYGLKPPDRICELQESELSEPEEHRLKKDNRQLRQRVEELLEQRIRDEDLQSLFVKASERSLDPPRWLTPSVKGSKERAIATALLSDCHFDEVVNPAEFNYRNAYNRAIAEKRLKNYFQNVVRLSRDYINGINMEYLVLALLGDMFSGNIHEELRQTNEGPILDSMLYWSEQITGGIEMLLDVFDAIYIPCIVGNHGRLDRKPRFKFRAKENFDWLLYHIVAKHFRNVPEVEFAIPESADFSYTVYNTRYLISHGDQFRGGSGIAGILTPVFLGDHRKTRRNIALDQPYDHMLIGHFHQQRDMGSVIINGSLKGYDEFAYLNNYPFEPPRQAYWLTDPEHGKSGISADIHVIDTAEDWLHYGQE